MTGNPYIVPAFILIAAVLLGRVTALARRSVRPAGRHSRPARRAHAAKPFADPQDLADPDGEQYVGQLTGPKVIIAVDDSEARDQLAGLQAKLNELDHIAEIQRWPAEPAIPDLEWWKQLPPAGEPLEVLTGPGTRIPQTSEATIGVLARVRDKLLPDAWRPEPGEVTFTPADADATRFDLQPVPDVIP